MNDELDLGATTLLPAAPAGWFEYGYTLLWDGNLALIRTDRDIHTEHRRWRDQVQGGDVHAHPPDFRTARLRLSKFDGAIEAPTNGSSKVNHLPDGRWLIVSGRAAPNEANARLFAADGTPAGAFPIGDGIAHIRCAPDGAIWVGYFDEGVFSLPDRDGNWPVSSSGVARFSPDGRVLWRFNSEDPADLFIADCYSLTVDGNTAWCCPFEDFPIVRIRDGVVDRWSNDVAGARAIAVDGDYALLAGGYGDNSDRIAVLRLDHDRARQIGEGRLRPPERNAARLLEGQGDTLHIVGQGRWTKLSVTMARAALENRPF